jgi:hypothetical protein
MSVYGVTVGARGVESAHFQYGVVNHALQCPMVQHVSAYAAAWSSGGVMSPSPQVSEINLHPERVVNVASLCVCVRSM